MFHMPTAFPCSYGTYNRGVIATTSALPAIREMLPASLTIPDISEEDFLAICAQFPDSLVEYTADGRLIIMPPTDPDSDARNAELIFQLKLWARSATPGLVNGDQAGFRLPSGARRSPNAAWSNLARWQRAKQRGERYPVFTPEFMVELRSPDDRMRDLRDKMQDYMENGCQLGWLIDPIARRVEIYRPGQAVEVLESPADIRGEGPVEGFVLDLKPIYA